jgi:class 3 adenylate cyclase
MRERAGLIVLLVAIVGVLSQLPVAQRLEQDVGLDWLFGLRGPVEAPPGAVVVAIDPDSIGWLQRHSGRLDRTAPELHACLGEDAAARLATMRNASQVPRELFACLVERLAGAGARLQIFDIHFALSMEGDARLAEAMRDAGSVILLERILSGPRPGGGAPVLIRRSPPQRLRRAALGTVAFKVENAPGGLTTRYLVRLEAFPDLPAMPVEAHRRTGGDPPEGGEARLFWLCGPPGTVPTVSLRGPLSDGRARAAVELEGEVVFVGAVSQQPEFGADGFAVPAFSSGTEWISGVELAATAYLNLRHGDGLPDPPPPARTALAGLVALLACGAALLAPARLSLLAVLAAGGAVGAAAALLFQHGVWLPALVPLLLTLPLAVFIALERKLRVARRIASALLPHSCGVETLERRNSGPRVRTASALFVDMVGSTARAQALGPDAYGRLIADYYRHVSQAVESAGGAVINCSGDGVLALFSEGPSDARQARGACDAARTVEATLRTGAPAPYSVRIGIATGPIVLGALRFGEHINVSAMGDAVNRAFRLQELGRPIALEERAAAVILIDEETARALPRDAGAEFRMRAVLRGTAAPASVYRLAGPPGRGADRAGDR